jgi:hypothetical protein
VTVWPGSARIGHEKTTGDGPTGPMTRGRGGKRTGDETVYAVTFCADEGAQVVMTCGRREPPLVPEAHRHPGRRGAWEPPHRLSPQRRPRDAR